MRRWQVKQNPEKDWSDHGPDLLRTTPNARAVLHDELSEHTGGWFVQVDPGAGYGPWQGPFERAEILDAFEDWKPGDGDRARWTRKQKDGSGFDDPKGVVRCAVIDVPAHNGCTDHTDQAIALCERAFPQAAFGGAFVCKQISGSSSWSQHAYGKAYDHSAYDANDEATAWCLRMARENRMRDGEADILLPVWQVLGSQGGRAGIGDNSDGTWIGSFAWSAGGVDDSHEWHVHLSAGKSASSGTPSCAGGAQVFEVAEVDPHEATDAEDA